MCDNDVIRRPWRRLSPQVKMFLFCAVATIVCSAIGSSIGVLIAAALW
jgi:hypothetical protein